MGGSRDSNGEPWFVAAKDMVNNELIVVQGHDHPLLLDDGLKAGQLHWISGERTLKPIGSMRQKRVIASLMHPVKLTRLMRKKWIFGLVKNNGQLPLGNQPWFMKAMCVWVAVLSLARFSCSRRITFN